MAWMQGRKVEVEQDRLGARIVDRVGDIVGRQADVDRLHHRAHHRDREIALVIAVAVPFHDGDRVAFFDADLRQPARQTPDAFAELSIGAAPYIAINDLLLGRARQRLVQQVFDEQRIAISRRRRLDQLDGHFTLLPLRDFSAFGGLNY